MATVHQGGPRRLWDDLEGVRIKWDERGRFPLHTVRVALSPDGGSLASPDGTWSFSV
jgi:hypothetical protein